MGLFDKVKNLFTEEVEEEKPIKKEVRHVEIASPRREDVKIDPIVEEVKPQPKEEKFLFFDDKDFEDLEKKEERELKKIKEEPKIQEKKEEKLPYNGNKPSVVPVIEKKVFTPSPIISPVYGVLNKNYKKEDIASKPERSRRPYNNSKEITVDDVRARAFSTLEDDLKEDLLLNDYVINKKEPVEDDLDIFKDIEEDFENNDTLGSINSLQQVIIDDEYDDDTEILAQKLREQQRKLDEINEIINEEPKEIKRPSLDEVLEKAESLNDIKRVDEDIEKEDTETLEESCFEEKEEQKKIISEEDIETLEESNLESEEEMEELKPIEELVEDSEDSTEEKREISNNLDDAFSETLGELDQVISNEKEESKTKKKKNKDLTDSELLNLIDTMYEKRDEEE